MPKRGFYFPSDGNTLLFSTIFVIISKGKLNLVDKVFERASSSITPSGLDDY